MASYSLDSRQKLFGYTDRDDFVGYVRFLFTSFFNGHGVFAGLVFVFKVQDDALLPQDQDRGAFFNKLNRIRA